MDLLPNHFSDVPELLKEITDQRVIMATVSPIDEKGFFSMGTNCDYTAPLAKAAKTLLLEVNEYMPRTYGRNQIHLSEVTALVEHHQPLIESPVQYLLSRKKMRKSAAMLLVSLTMETVCKLGLELFQML